jgi:hypothetical protein
MHGTFDNNYRDIGHYRTTMYSTFDSNYQDIDHYRTEYYYVQYFLKPYRMVIRSERLLDLHITDSGNFVLVSLRLLFRVCFCIALCMRPFILLKFKSFEPHYSSCHSVAL